MTHSVCVWSAHQNVLFPSRCNGLGLDIQRPGQINFALPEVFPLKLICNHFYIVIIHKSIFFTGTSLVHQSGNAADKYDKIIVLIFSQWL